MCANLDVAIIGCGWAGTQHARAVRKGLARLRWTVDSNLARAQALAHEQAGTQATADYRAPLSDPQVDAVIICLPHNLHAPVAIDAARAGKHVLCEKPIAATLAEADAMIAAAGNARVVLMVAENERYNPLYRKMRELLDAGAIGRPALVQSSRECYLVRSFVQDRPWFLDRRAAAGGMMMSGGVHTFETMRLLLGELAAVQALRAPQRFLEMEGDDTSVALVRFQSGVVGTMVQSFVMKDLHTASGRERHAWRIDGELGSMSVVDGQTIVLFSEHPEYRRGSHLSQLLIHVPPQDTFELEMAHFCHCVESGEEPLTSGRSQRRPLEAVLAAYKSMELGGQPVVLSA